MSRRRIIGTGNELGFIGALSVGSIALGVLAKKIHDDLIARDINIPVEQLEEMIEETRRNIEGYHTRRVMPTNSDSSHSTSTPNPDEFSDIESFDNSSSHSYPSSYYSISSESSSSNGDGLKRRNNWVSHVKNYARQHNMSYFQALKDQKCKTTYRN